MDVERERSCTCGTLRGERGRTRFYGATGTKLGFRRFWTKCARAWRGVGVRDAHGRIGLMEGYRRATVAQQVRDTADGRSLCLLRPTSRGRKHCNDWAR